MCLVSWGTAHSDLAGDVDYCRSTTGVLFFGRENLVSWLLQKQKAVAKLACEAEYMASAAVASQAVWLY
jgi:hypothetical protein